MRSWKKSPAWQPRPLERMYPVVLVDALRIKIREEGPVRNKAIYLALGILPDATRDILGVWIENTEGAKFWLTVFTDLKLRGVPGDHPADLHRATDAQFAGVRKLEG